MLFAQFQQLPPPTIYTIHLGSPFLERHFRSIHFEVVSSLLEVLISSLRSVWLVLFWRGCHHVRNPTFVIQNNCRTCLDYWCCPAPNFWTLLSTLRDVASTVRIERWITVSTGPKVWRNKAIQDGLKRRWGRCWGRAISRKHFFGTGYWHFLYTISKFSVRTLNMEKLLRWKALSQTLLDGLKRHSQ